MAPTIGCPCLALLAFATSLPELLVSLNAALNGSPSIAINNVVGSNVANIGLVLGITALIGALLLGRLSNSIGAKKVILLTLVIWTVMVIITYALPAGQQNPYLVIAAGIGFVLGGSQALSRSLYSQVIPRSH